MVAMRAVAAVDGGELLAYIASSSDLDAVKDKDGMPLAEYHRLSGYYFWQNFYRLQNGAVATELIDRGNVEYSMLCGHGVAKYGY